MCNRSRHHIRVTYIDRSCNENTEKCKVILQRRLGTMNGVAYMIVCHCPRCFNCSIEQLCATYGFIVCRIEHAKMCNLRIQMCVRCMHTAKEMNLMEQGLTRQLNFQIPTDQTIMQLKQLY